MRGDYDTPEQAMGDSLLPSPDLRPKPTEEESHMTPQERRALLDRLQADVSAELAEAEQALKPLAETYNRAVHRVSTLQGQLRRVEESHSYFGPHNDPPAAEGTASVGMAEADLDDVLHGR